ncbi:MAG: IclR family transcriptional regulator C-terminal domain-containing protein [Pseudomonadota bacterium]
MSALSNSFSMIDVICRSGPKGLSFSDVVRQTGVSKASAHRLLRELVELNALEFNAEKKRYRGGLLLARLGGGVISNYDLREHARPALEALHERTAQVTTLGVLGDETGIYIDKIESTDFGIRLHSEIGKPFPLHCTAMGKVLLAYSGPEALKKLGRKKLKAYTQASITDVKKLRKHLSTAAKPLARSSADDHVDYSIFYI